MDIREYIASGILESYTLGLTSDEESREVERMVARYPEIKAELEQVQLALEGYAAAFEKAPPAALKSKVMNAVTGSSQETHIVSIDREEKMRSKSSSRFFVYLAAASIALLIGAGFYIKHLQERLDNQRHDMQQISADYDHLKKQMDEQLAQNDLMMQVIKDPRNRMIRLKGLDIAPSSLATVYWNPASNETYLTINNLPEPPQGMQYQLWAIVEGQPVDAGMIDMSDEGLHKMKSFANAQAFAITLEKEGGSPTPNLSAMYVMGSV